ncbi:MAG: hypothetical protein K0Q49_1506 [Haloplasmataceae bacterium]|jgi:hypothetical protein|nr:hypothetical protein [Haloplasmataceae bacterium]
MKFPKARKTKVYPIELNLDTIYILEQFSNYANIPINEVADQMLLQLIEEPNFNKFVKKKRNNKRLMEILETYKD